MDIHNPTPLTHIPKPKGKQGTFAKIWIAMTAHKDKTTALTVKCASNDQARSLVRRAKDKGYNATQRSETVYISLK